jgi:hypothetical protein
VAGFKEVIDAGPPEELEDEVSIGRGSYDDDAASVSVVVHCQARFPRRRWRPTDGVGFEAGEIQGGGGELVSRNARLLKRPSRGRGR